MIPQFPSHQRQHFQNVYHRTERILSDNPYANSHRGHYTSFVQDPNVNDFSDSSADPVYPSSPSPCYLDDYQPLQTAYNHTYEQESRSYPAYYSYGKNSPLYSPNPHENTFEYYNQESPPAQFCTPPPTTIRMEEFGGPEPYESEDMYSSRFEQNEYRTKAIVNKRRDGVETQAKLRLRPVSELPDIFRGLFKFGVFNAVQSSCYDDIMKTDENMVISAPTGSGKTTLFELAIIRMLGQARKTGNAPKCVYMAPTKALCSEKQRDWAAKFGPLGFKCTQLRTDRRYRLLGQGVTTAEKWDSLTRSWEEHTNILSRVQLILVDEVHILNENRGCTLEVVISRMKLQGTGVRFIMVSATVPNIIDVASWVGSNTRSDSPAKTFEFGEQYRPCKLSRVVHSFNLKGQNQYAFAHTLDQQLFSVLAEHSVGKPILVFVPTRKGVFATAEQLFKDYGAALKSKSNTPWATPPRMERNFHDEKLKQLATLGIGVHHAGLTLEDRRAVEEMYMSGALRVIVATSTLAVGVNLPAHTVVIKGVWGFQDGKLVEYSDLSITQMIGRAGRPQFDQDGLAIIMCERELERKYQALVSGSTTLESCLHKNLLEHINSEIGLGTIKCVQSAKKWLQTSFLFQRIRKNPMFYQIGKDDEQTWEDKLEDLVAQSVADLRQSSLVTAKDEDKPDDLSCTEFGEIMSKFFIRYRTMNIIMDLAESPTTRDILEALSKSEEMSPSPLRASERKILGELRKHPEIRFEVPKALESHHKPFLLIQASLGSVNLSAPEYHSSDCQLALDALGALKHASRIANAIVEVGIAQKRGAQIKHGLELLRCLNAKAWEDRPSVLSQVPGIGEKSIKLLAEKGIKSLDTLCSQSAVRLEALLSRHPPFGQNIISFVKQIPQYSVTIQSTGSRITTDSVEIDLEISCTSSSVVESGTKDKKNKGPKYGLTNILTVTSDLDLVDFRRTTAKSLLGGRTFSTTAFLTRPSQSVVVEVSSTNIAGTTMVFNFRPGIPASKFPIVDTRPPSSIDLDLEGLEDCSELWKDTWRDSDDEKPVAQEMIPDTGLEPPLTLQDKKQKQPTSKIVRAQEMLRNGKYSCNHPCRDKTQCRHLCCREGLDHPPKQRAGTNAGNESSGVGTENQRRHQEPKTSAGKRDASKPEAKKVKTTPSDPQTRLSLGLNAAQTTKAREQIKPGARQPNFDINFADLGSHIRDRPSAPKAEEEDLPLLHDVLLDNRTNQQASQTLARSQTPEAAEQVKSSRAASPSDIYVQQDTLEEGDSFIICETPAQYRKRPLSSSLSREEQSLRSTPIFKKQKRESLFLSPSQESFTWSDQHTWTTGTPHRNEEVSFVTNLDFKPTLALTSNLTTSSASLQQTQAFTAKLRSPPIASAALHNDKPPKKEPESDSFDGLLSDLQNMVEDGDIV